MKIERGKFEKAEFPSLLGALIGTFQYSITTVQSKFNLHLVWFLPSVVAVIHGMYKMLRDKPYLSNKQRLLESVWSRKFLMNLYKMKNCTFATNLSISENMNISFAKHCFQPELHKHTYTWKLLDNPLIHQISVTPSRPRLLNKLLQGTQPVASFWSTSSLSFVFWIYQPKALPVFKFVKVYDSRNVLCMSSTTHKKKYPWSTLTSGQASSLCVPPNSHECLAHSKSLKSCVIVCECPTQNNTFVCGCFAVHYSFGWCKEGLTNAVFLTTTQVTVLWACLKDLWATRVSSHHTLLPVYLNRFEHMNISDCFHYCTDKAFAPMVTPKNKKKSAPWDY